MCNRNSALSSSRKPKGSTAFPRDCCTLRRRRFQTGATMASTKEYREKYNLLHPNWFKDWKAKNLERYNSYQAGYRSRNRVKQSEYNRVWREKNPQRVKAGHLKHYRNNSADYKFRSRQRDGVLAKADKPTLSAISKWERKWKSKTSVICFWCSQSIIPKDCHSDHIVALSLGGQHKLSNLCVSCSKCNLSKHNKSLEEWNGLIASPVLPMFT